MYDGRIALTGQMFVSSLSYSQPFALPALRSSVLSAFRTFCSTFLPYFPYSALPPALYSSEIRLFSLGLLIRSQRVGLVHRIKSIQWGRGADKGGRRPFFPGAQPG